MASIFERIISAFQNNNQSNDIASDENIIKDDSETARDYSASEIGSILSNAINAVYEDDASTVEQSIADEMRAHPDRNIGDIIAENFGNEGHENNVSGEESKFQKIISDMLGSDKDAADKVGHLIVDNIKSGDGIVSAAARAVADVTGNDFTDVKSEIFRNMSDAGMEQEYSNHTENSENADSTESNDFRETPKDDLTEYTTLKERYTEDKKTYISDNTFVIAEKLELNIEAYHTGQPGANGMPVSGGDIAMDVIALTRSDLFSSLLEIAVRSYFDEKYPPKDVEATVTTDEQKVNDVNSRANSFDIDKFSDSTGVFHDDGRITSHNLDMQTQDKDNPSTGYYMGVDMKRNPDDRASDISTTVWRSGHDYSDTVMIDGKAESLHIPDIRLVEHNDTRYLVDSFGKVLVHDGDRTSGKDFPDYFPKLDISQYRKSGEMIQAAAVDKGVSVEQYKSNISDTIKEHFVERTADRIEKHGEYIAKELLPDLKEMSADYHEKIELLEHRIEDVKAAGGDTAADQTNDKISDMEWSKDKLDFAASRMDSRIEKLENTLTSYENASKIASSKDTDVEAKFGVVVGADKDSSGKVTNVDYGLSKEDIKKVLDVIFNMDERPDVDADDRPEAMSNDEMAAEKDVSLTAKDETKNDIDKTVFIHYGSDAFDINQVSDIQNRNGMSKPVGGLWASPIDTKWGWKDWCTAEHFKFDETHSFTFTLKDTANVCVINTDEDARKLPLLAEPTTYMNIEPDYEALKKSGIDAVIYNLSGDSRLYYTLYGVDCDSIVVFNKDIVEPPVDHFEKDVEIHQGSATNEKADILDLAKSDKINDIEENKLDEQDILKDTSSNTAQKENVEENHSISSSEIAASEYDGVDDDFDPDTGEGPLSADDWEAFEKAEAQAVKGPYIISVDDDGTTHVEQLSPPGDDFWGEADKVSVASNEILYSDTETADKLHDTIMDYYRNFDRDNTSYAPDYTDRMSEYADHIKDVNCNHLSDNVQLPMRDCSTQTEWKELQIDRYTEAAKSILSDVGFERNNLNAYIDAHGYREFETDAGLQFVADNVGPAEYDKVLSEYRQLSGRVDYLNELENGCKQIVQVAASDIGTDEKLNAIEKNFNSAFSPGAIQETRMEVFQEPSSDVEKAQLNAVPVANEVPPNDITVEVEDVPRDLTADNISTQEAAESRVDSADIQKIELPDSEAKNIINDSAISKDADKSDEDDRVIVAMDNDDVESQTGQDIDRAEDGVGASENDVVFAHSDVEVETKHQDGESNNDKPDDVTDVEEDGAVTKDDIKEAMNEYLDQGTDGTFSFKEDFLDLNEGQINPSDLYEALSEKAHDMSEDENNSDKDLDDQIEKVASLLDVIEDCVVSGFAQQFEYTESLIDALQDGGLSEVFEVGLERQLDTTLDRLDSFISIADYLNEKLDPEWQADTEAIKDAVCEKLEIANFSDSTVDRICDVVETLDSIFHGFGAALADIGSTFSKSDAVDTDASDIEAENAAMCDMSDTINDTAIDLSDMTADMLQANDAMASQESLDISGGMNDTGFAQDIELGELDNTSDDGIGELRDFMEAGSDAAVESQTAADAVDIDDLL